MLNAILPDVGAEDPPSSFTQTGHIGEFSYLLLHGQCSSTGHVNLRDEWLPYKHLIGQVILDVSGFISAALQTSLPREKNPQMRTVVNKLNTIHAEYRYFDMEVLAGEPDFVATVVSPIQSATPCADSAERRQLLFHPRLPESLLELPLAPRT